MNIEYIVKNIPFENYTINDILLNDLNFSKRLLKFLVNNRLILCNNSICNTNTYVKINDVVTVFLDYEEDNSNILPINMGLDIVYQDDWLLIINKPPEFYS